MEELLKNDVSLLTLPRCDIGLPMPKAENSDQGQEPVYPSLVVLELPPNIKAEDLKDARFVIPKEQAQANLVLEGPGRSFQVQRVETSNSIILVPPPPPSSRGNDDIEDADHQGKSLRNRRKITESGNYLQVVLSRVLHQGNGAYFLEGRELPLALRDLRDNLPVWDPYNNTTDDDVAIETGPNGPTVSILGNSLAKSRAQISKGLKHLEAVECDDGQYCRLAEEVRLDVLDSVLATLVEAFPMVATRDIVFKEFFTAAQERLPKTLQEEKTAFILIRNCLRTLMATEHSALPMVSLSFNNGEAYQAAMTTTLRLDIPRVGAAVASRILTRQTTWEESLFLARWQTEMPGFDTVVSCDWLKGHAVRVADPTTVSRSTDIQRKKKTKTATTPTSFYWKYLPVSEVVGVDAPDGIAVWKRLIKAKPEWTFHDLQPYMKYWELFSGRPSTSVLACADMRTENDVRIYYSA